MLHHSKAQAKATAYARAQMVVMTLVRIITRNIRLIGRNYYQLTGRNKGKQSHATKQAMEVVEKSNTAMTTDRSLPTVSQKLGLFRSTMTQGVQQPQPYQRRFQYGNYSNAAFQYPTKQSADLSMIVPKIGVEGECLGDQVAGENGS
ncbi:hypothetical protein Tco_0477581 [Tanacetum coccineum]